jgi:uncharacterized protein
LLVKLYGFKMKLLPQIIFCIFYLFSKSFAQDKTINLITSTGQIVGTLNLPYTNSKIPIVLIISGSGPTDRDGNNPSMQNNSLKMLANELYLNGIASVRFDKRGIAASANAMGKEEDLRFETYINDVNDWINLLGVDKRFSKIIVAGHSEGSLIGMIASSKSSHVSKFISISGAGSPADEILKEQINKQPILVREMVMPKIDSLKNGLLLQNVNPALNALFRPSVQPYLISWFKYDPVIEIAKLKIPILITQGETDIQVSVNEATKLFANAKNKTLRLIPNMNHVLKNIETLEMNAQMKTYSDPILPINSELIKEIVKFIKK